MATEQKKPDFQVTSILGGQSPTIYFQNEGQFIESRGIDPDLPLRSTPFSNRPAGHIAPALYADGSGAELNSTPMWIITNPKNELIYTYLFNGKVVSYTSTLGSETDVGTPTSGAGNGAVYYNNYIYFMTPTDVSRYGPLSGTPAIRNTAWTANTPLTQTGGGLGLNALIDTTYPPLQTRNYPNHAGHVHGDGAMYFCDFNGGRGYIHKIKTAHELAYDAEVVAFTAGLLLTGQTSGATATIIVAVDAGSTGILTLGNINGTFANDEQITDSGSGDATANGTVIEGTRDDGSAYNVLDLPFGYFPFDIESYGTDLAIIATQTISGALVKQGESALFLWDPTNTDSFYQQIPIPDSFASAIVNKNGELYVFSGNLNNGFRILKYLGGYSFEEIDFFEEGYSPYQGGVDVYGNRLAIGSRSNENANAHVFSIGYKSAKLPGNARHSMTRPSSGGGAPIVTAVKYAQQASGVQPRVLVGWKDNTESGLDIAGSTVGQASVFRTQMFTVDQRFSIDRIRIVLSEAIGANTSIAPVIYFDRGGTTKTLATINNTNFTGSETVINYKAQEIADATTSDFIAYHDFFLELTFSGSDANQIMLPIDFWITKTDDN